MLLYVVIILLIIVFLGIIIYVTFNEYKEKQKLLRIEWEKQREFEQNHTECRLCLVKKSNEEIINARIKVYKFSSATGNLWYREDGIVCTDCYNKRNSVPKNKKVYVRIID